MANKMLFDDTRALRREQREARLERKARTAPGASAQAPGQHGADRDTRARGHRRREPRDEQPPAAIPPVAVEMPQAEVVPAAVVAAVDPAPTLDDPGEEAREEPLAERPEPAIADPRVDDGEPLAEPAPAPKRDARVSRRKGDVTEFLERRDQVLRLARDEARERIERYGEEQTVQDALVALAHSQASPWRRHRERLAEAIAGGRIPEVGAAARRGCRGAANDAARTSHKAPDPQLAMAVTVAYAVIARAPWAAVRGRRAERSGTGRSLPRAFWR